MRTVYVDLYEISELQRKIMGFIGEWASTQRVPISQKKIVEKMKGESSEAAVVYSLKKLVKMGYLRRAVTVGSGESGIGAEKTKYVQLRGI